MIFFEVPKNLDTKNFKDDRTSILFALIHKREGVRSGFFDEFPSENGQATPPPPLSKFLSSGPTPPPYVVFVVGKVGQK